MSERRAERPSNEPHAREHEEPSLEALAARAVAGDAAALAAVCRALESPVFRLCLRMLGDPRDAEDATQDVLVKVVTSLSQFEGRSSLRTWVHTIATRHVLAMKKSRAEERALDEVSFSTMLEHGLAYGATQPASAEDAAFLDEIRLACTQGMLLMLGREERLALVLVELLGLDAREAAEVAEVSHEALRQRLARGRAKLTGFLQRECGLVSDEARCRCEAQAPAKRRVSPKRRFLPLVEGDLPLRAPHRHDAIDGTTELRELRALAAAFRDGGLFHAPATLRARLTAALPHVLGPLGS